MERRANARVSCGDKAAMEAFASGSLAVFRRVTLQR